MKLTTRIGTLVVPMGAVILLATGATGRESGTDTTSPEESAWAPAVDPKPLSSQVLKALDWLKETQEATGGWSQGEESRQMRGSTNNLNVRSVPNVGDTAMATLALIRAGDEPGSSSEFRYQESVEKGLEFICDSVEQADDESLALQTIQGTRLQMKLGTNVDTFMASLVLAEAQEALEEGNLKRRVGRALDKVLTKIEKNQLADGSWKTSGWATDLAFSLAGKGLNRARQAGADVDLKVISKAADHAAKAYDEEQGTFSSRGSAGIELYAGSNAVAQLQDRANSNRQRRMQVEQILESSDSDQEKAKARIELQEIEKEEQALTSVRQEIVRKVQDDKFIAGFGSNGGEEFLSYMNIGESLVVEGGKEWKDWDRRMTANLIQIQNADGTWTGHHCITGRTFCTSTALLVLMVDRAPVPISGKLGKR